MKTIKTEDILVLIQWVYSMQSFEKIANNNKLKDISEEEFMKLIENGYDNFKYSELMSKIVSKEKNTFEVSDIEDFFVDVYMVYDKIKHTQGKIEEEMPKNPIFSLLPDKFMQTAKDEVKKFITVFESCIKNCDFETANMRGIQRNVLTDFMNDLIREEKYEECAILRDKIDS